MKQEFVLFVIVAFASQMPVCGGGVFVCPNTQYPTIQSGVNAASPGSTVRVCPGTYAEQVTVEKPNITIEAQGAVIVTEPATSNLSYGFLVSAPNIKITGFQITGFKDHIMSAGIYVDRATGTQLTRNVIYGNCNGIVLNQANNTSASGNNSSQNPFPDPSNIVPQPGIPEPSQAVPTACVVSGFNANFQPILGVDGYGIQSLGGHGSQIAGNDVEQNGECGIQLVKDKGGSAISGNRLFANTGPQLSPCGNVDVRSSSGGEQISITGNNIDTGSNGIMLVNSDRIQVANNSVTNLNQGITVMDSSRNQIEQNQSTRNIVGIYLTGQNNQVDRNNASNNQFGIFVTVDGCPDCTMAQPGQVFLTTSGNEFSYNTILSNGMEDVEDFSIQSRTQCPTDCNAPLPPPPTTTLDTWQHNACNTAIPASLCPEP